MPVRDFTVDGLSLERLSRGVDSTRVAAHKIAFDAVNALLLPEEGTGEVTTGGRIEEAAEILGLKYVGELQALSRDKSLGLFRFVALGELENKRPLTEILTNLAAGTFREYPDKITTSLKPFRTKLSISQEIETRNQKILREMWETAISTYSPPVPNHYVPAATSVEGVADAMARAEGEPLAYVDWTASEEAVGRVDLFYFLEADDTYEDLFTVTTDEWEPEITPPKYPDEKWVFTPSFMGGKYVTEDSVIDLILPVTWGDGDRYFVEWGYSRTELTTRRIRSKYVSEIVETREGGLEDSFESESFVVSETNAVNFLRTTNVLGKFRVIRI